MRILLCLCLFLSSWCILAQNSPHLRKGLLQPAVWTAPTDFPHSPISDESTDLLNEPLQMNFLNQETAIGNTTYDLQTNGATQNRLIIAPDGRRAAVWIQSQERNMVFADRGTGYNYFDGNAWQNIPTARLESERVGWPSLSLLDDGRVHIVTHTGNSELHTVTMNIDGSNLQEAKIPDNTPNGLLWPRSAAAGQTVHVIALTTPSGQMGSPYQGIDGNLLYYRSSDGGQTWDVVDFEIPGIDTSTYRFITADTYTIEASGDIVAVVVFASWGDILLLKSFDRGATWESRIVLDFPLDGYDIDDGYAAEDLPDDPLAPNPLAIYTSNGTGEALIDDQGLVHIVYADGYVLDEMPGDSVSSFFPGWSGISYWNETLAAPIFAGGVADFNGNDTLDIDLGATPRYGGNTITSMPTLATNNNGEIIIVYSMVSEANFNELDEQHYRHLVAIKSLDNGMTWGPIYDLINIDLVDEDFYEFVEAVYPNAHPSYGDTLYLVYQQDFFPGHTFTDGEDDPQADNFITQMAVPVNLIPDISSVSTQDRYELLPAKLYPTLTDGKVILEISESLIGEVDLTVFDALGHLVLRREGLLVIAEIDVQSLAPGPYFFHLQAPNASSVFKVFRK